MANTRLNFDEINSLIEAWRGVDLSKNKKQIIDGILDYLIYAYIWGVEDVSDALGKNIEPDSEKMKKAIYRKIDGKDFEERLNEYADNNDIEGIKRVAETETHRDYNEAIIDSARNNGAKNKTWNTMQDWRVREEHTWLEGVTVPIDADFYIGDASAPAPGLFGVPELDVNCRCFLTVS